jgi:hypothetical protein
MVTLGKLPTMRILTKYSLGKEMTKDESGRICSIHGVNKKLYKILLENIMERNHLGKQRYRWNNNIKMDLREVGEQLGRMFSFREFHDMFSEHPVSAIHNSTHIPVSVLPKLLSYKKELFAFSVSY